MLLFKQDTPGAITSVAPSSTSMAKPLACAALFACVLSTSATADSFRYGQAACQYEPNLSTGRSFEVYSEVDPWKEGGTIGFRYTVEFMKPEVYDPCYNMLGLMETQINLDIQRKRLELEELQARIDQRLLQLAQQEQGGPVGQPFEEEW